MGDEFNGLISDAMGHLRDGMYEKAETILEDQAMVIAEKLPEPERSQRCAWLLRKLSIVYEYQDRVDECHNAWTRANALERGPPISDDAKPQWALSVPPSSSGSRMQSRKAKAFKASEATSLNREEITQGVAAAVQRVSDAKLLLERQTEANERFISSVLSMAREDSEYAPARRVLSAGLLDSMSRRGKRDSKSRTEDETSVSSSNSILNRPEKCKPKSVRRARESGAQKKRKRAGGRQRKVATIDELKKIVRSDPELAGLCALKMARRYAKIRQPKNSLGAYRKALSKELKNFQRIEDEQHELEANWGNLRGLKEKREGEERRAQLAIDWDKSEGIIVSAHTGMSKLLLASPIAALDSEVIAATMPSRIEEARGWFPTIPKELDAPKSIFCAVPVIIEQLKQWRGRFPVTERPQKRRDMLWSVINMLEGCADGPLGDFAGECLEELLETYEDGDNMRLLSIAGIMYSRRRHFRRAQEIYARIEALQRGETRARVQPRRHVGEPLLHSSLHVDPAVKEYLSNLPETIVGNMAQGDKGSNETLESTRSNTTAFTRDKVKSNGTTGTYGDPLDDTWRGNLLRPGMQIPMHGAVLGEQRKESLVIPTTVGRSKDERAQPLVRSVAVAGSKIGATGGAQLLRRLMPNDLRGGTKSNTKWRDDLSIGRRRGGHSEMWHKHLGHTPSSSSSPQALVMGSSRHGIRGDGGRAPWQGLPIRHWMEPHRSETRKRNEMLAAAGVLAEGAPPKSSAKLSRRDGTEKSRAASAAKLATQFGSKQAEKDRIVQKSREYVRGLPPPTRDPLSTPGVRDLSTPGSSRGGMAFWMDMPALEMNDMALRPLTGTVASPSVTATPGEQYENDNNIDQSRVASRLSQIMPESDKSVLASSRAGTSRTNTSHGLGSRANTSHSLPRSRAMSRGYTAESFVTRVSRVSTASHSTANALDFLERPPSEITSSTNLPQLRGQHTPL